MAGPDTQEPKQEAPQRSGGSAMTRILLILVIVLLLVIGAGAGVFFFAPQLLGIGPADAPEAAGGPPVAIEEGQAAETAKTVPELGVLYPMQDFIVNLSDSQGKRYLKVRMSLDLSNPQARTEVESRLPQIQDSILILLASKSYEDVASTEGKMRLRMEVISRVNNFLAKGRVTNVYFTEFVVQ